MLVLLACVAMFLRDGLATVLTIAEARGRALTAGVLDGLCDLAAFAVTFIGVNSVFKHGVVASIPLLAAMTATSVLGTWMWVKLGTRLMPDE